jgi:hypothetical protein
MFDESLRGIDRAEKRIVVLFAEPIAARKGNDLAAGFWFLSVGGKCRVGLVPRSTDAPVNAVPRPQPLLWFDSDRLA